MLVHQRVTFLPVAIRRILNISSIRATALHCHARHRAGHVGKSGVWALNDLAEPDRCEDFSAFADVSCRKMMGNDGTITGT